MIKWTHIKGEPHIKGVCDEGIWWIRTCNKKVTGIYRIFNGKDKILPGSMTVQEAKDECELLTEIYRESLTIK